jgi:hypothetical protein
LTRRHRHPTYLWLLPRLRQPAEQLPGPEYHWSSLARWVTASLQALTGRDCGKLVWLRNHENEELRPQLIVWASPDPNEAIPPLIFTLFPSAYVSVALTPRVDQFSAASPAIITKASVSPWTVDAGFNTANNAIYCIGAGGAAPGTNHGSGAGGGGGGACVFVNNYNNSWTPGTSTATFQVTGSNSGAEGNSTNNTTFDASAFVARCGAGTVSGISTGSAGGLATSSVVPAGGTKNKGGIGGNGATSGSTRAGGGGGGAGGSFAAGNDGAGTAGGQGDGTHGGAAGAPGANGTEFDASHGSGGGGNGSSTGVGNNGGQYGGGAGQRAERGGADRPRKDDTSPE